MNEPYIKDFYVPGVGDILNFPISMPQIHSVAGQQIIWVVFIIFCLFYSLISGVLYYHWAAYGMHSRMIVGARILYTAVAGFLFAFAFSMLINMIYYKVI